MNYPRIGLVFGFAIALSQCKPVEIMPTQGSLNVSIQYNVDGNPLLSDSSIYQNAAGNRYSINRLEYFLSNFELLKNDGKRIKIKGVWYVDAFVSSKNTIKLDSIPVGNYDTLSFYIGLDSAQNQTNFLPNTQENQNMAWPTPMGGGYHFLKLEGYYTDINAVKSGYAMHLGKTKNAVRVKIPAQFLLTYTNETASLTMNINEWFRNPNPFNFDTDGQYIMSVDSAMAKIAANGVSVFKFKK